MILGSKRYDKDSLVVAHNKQYMTTYKLTVMRVLFLVFCCKDRTAK